MGLARLWAIDAHPGPFNSELASRGYRTVGAEARGQGGLRAADLALYRDALRNLLRHAGALAGPEPARDDAPARRTTEVVAPVAGVVAVEPELGRRVDAGEPVATLVDEHGGVRARVVAPHPGELWAVRTFAPVARGDILCLVAHDS
jgi:predicted deacylase